MDALVRAAAPAPLVTPTSARLALTEASDVAAVAALVDRLGVVRLAARKAKLSLDAQNDWATVKLEAERKAGAMLTELRQVGDLRAGRPNADQLSALSALGISQQQSARWQRLAAVPEEAFRDWLAQVRESGAEVTEVGLTGLAARVKRPERVYVRPANLPAGTAPRNVVIEGDCLQVLTTLPDTCIDAMLTDPPAAVSFMGANWDGDRGGRDSWIAWMTEVLREGLRVLKPGAYALVWSLPRTSHWTALALEEAGFEIKDAIIHVFLQGMPKSADLGPAVAALDPTASAEWTGFAQGLKPAHETWWLARKPTDLSAAENVLAWGTGALNIDAARIKFASEPDERESKDKNRHGDFGTKPGGNVVYGDYSMVARTNYDPPGRWPPNVLLTDPVFDGDVEDVVGGGTSAPGVWGTSNKDTNPDRMFNGSPGRADYRTTASVDEREPAGKSRYFVVPKASRRDRDSGVRDAGPVENDHIAVKSLALMRHLVRLVAPKGSLVLDPFAGSGSTGVACQLEGMDYLLIEQEPDYVAIARGRLGLPGEEAT
jgi:site-specific DNA-methyltransferase (adenine-specific)